MPKSVRRSSKRPRRSALSSDRKPAEGDGELTRGHDAAGTRGTLRSGVLALRALDYARSLGFEPHRDFRRALLEPRPDTLLAPTLSISRPYFISGPSDDVAKVLKQLERSVGAGNYDFVAVPTGSDLDDRSDEGWDDDGDWEDDDDSDSELETDDRANVVETTGVVVGDAELNSTRGRNEAGS